MALCLRATVDVASSDNALVASRIAPGVRDQTAPVTALFRRFLAGKLTIQIIQMVGTFRHRSKDVRLLSRIQTMTMNRQLLLKFLCRETRLFLLHMSPIRESNVPNVPGSNFHDPGRHAHHGGSRVPCAYQSREETIQSHSQQTMTTE